MLDNVAGIDNISEGGLEGGTTDEETIDVLLVDQFTSILFSDGTTVEDSGLVSNILGDLGIQVTSNEVVDFLGLGGGGDLTGTDGPDGFVGNNDSFPLSFIQLNSDGFQLSFNNVVGLVGFSFG